VSSERDERSGRGPELSVETVGGRKRERLPLCNRLAGGSSSDADPQPGAVLGQSAWPREGAMIWQQTGKARRYEWSMASARNSFCGAPLWGRSACCSAWDASWARLRLYGARLLGKALSVVNGFPVMESPQLEAALGNFAS